MPILITNEPVSDHGGIQRYISKLGEALAERHRTVTLIEPLGASQKPPEMATTRRYKATNRLTAAFGTLVQLARTLIENPREPIIASVWYPSGFAAAIIPRTLRGPFAILAHGLEILPNHGGIRRRLMRWTYGRADVVIANSNYTHGLLEAAGVRAKCIVVPCGVDERPMDRRRSEQPKILAVGRLTKRKGFDRTIAAMPAVLAKIPNANLRIVGDGAQMSELQALSAKLGVTGNVDFLGPLSDDELADEYRAAWCLAMPARRIGDDMEGFGIVYLEAAMAGVASVGGIHSGAGDAIEDGETGYLVDGESVDAIAAAIVALVEDRERSESFGDKARERALRSFQWSHNCERVLAALRID